LEALIAIFAEIDDPRATNIRHELPAMLFIALAATLCGARSCVDIADFAAANAADLDQMVGLPHGPPSHDSFSRLFRLLDPAQVETALRRCLTVIRQSLGLGPPNGVVAVDGKRMRRAYEAGRACMPPLMVGVWEAETRLSLAARGNPAGNETQAALEALKTLDLKGCTVTADAAFCHAAFAAAILARQGDYALKLKANHGPLFAAAERAFAAAEARGRLAPLTREEAAHGRRERRSLSVLKTPRDAPAFPGLVAFGRIESERRVAGGKPEQRMHYLVLSQALPPAVAMAVCRTHWSIENQLHWPLDVVFREDDARTRKDHGPQNLSVIRRIALDILRAHPDKRSIRRKMNLAAWKSDFFRELFTHMR
jgi:predicted transposase YbfD/YdcC